MTSLKVSAALGAWCVAMSAMAAPFEVLPREAVAPANNPQSPDKIKLGRQLYFDGRLSVTGKISCNTCHDVTKGGEDNLATSAGHDGRRGGRSSPTVWNAAFQAVQFWDGRAATLEDQAKGPVTNPIEMGMPDPAAAEKAIRAVPGYVSQFESVFGKAEPRENAVNMDRIAQAIASYERTLITPRSPVDRFLEGDKKALTAAAQRGMKAVQTVGCVACHMGPNYSGPALPVGTGFYQKFPVFPGSAYDAKYKLTDDLGRFEVTKDPGDKNRWRVPTWRNIARTAPYFHNGSVATLDEAVRVMAKTQLNKTLTDGQVGDIVAFLTALNGERPAEKAPALP